MRRLLLSVAWLFNALGLYAGLVALEYYWNVPDWQPRFDWLAGLLLTWVLAMLAASWLLSRARLDRFIRGVSLLIGLGLLVLGVYVTGPEPVKPGFLGRESPSPLWYRGARLVVLCAPVVLSLTRSKPKRFGKN